MKKNFTDVLRLFLDREPAEGGQKMEDGRPAVRSNGRELWVYDMLLARWNGMTVQAISAYDFSPTITRYVNDLLTLMARYEAQDRLYQEVIVPIRVENDRGTLVSWQRSTYLTHWLYFPIDVPIAPREWTMRQNDYDRLKAWKVNHDEANVIRLMRYPWMENFVWVAQVHDHDYPSFSKQGLWNWIVKDRFPALGFIEGEDYHIMDYPPHGHGLYIRHTSPLGTTPKIIQWWFGTMKLDQVWTLLNQGYFGIRAREFPRLLLSPGIKAGYDQAVRDMIETDVRVGSFETIGTHLQGNDEFVEQVVNYLVKRPKLWKAIDHENMIQYKPEVDDKLAARFSRKGKVENG